MPSGTTDSVCSAARTREPRSGADVAVNTPTITPGWLSPAGNRSSSASLTLATASSMTWRGIPRPSTLRCTRSASARRMSCVSAITTRSINSRFQRYASEQTPRPMRVTDNPTEIRSGCRHSCRSARAAVTPKNRYTRPSSPSRTRKLPNHLRDARFRSALHPQTGGVPQPRSLER